MKNLRQRMIEDMKLRGFTRLHQQDLYGLLIKSAADSIIKLAADLRYLGGRVGVMAVLHTWGSNLSYHPHVHCLVTDGGLSPDGQTWMPARDNYLVPVNALSRLFRGIFLERIRRQFEDIHLPESIWQKTGSSTVNRPSRAPVQSSIISPATFTVSPSPTAESFLPTTVR